MRPIKKTVFTLNINNYEPAITSLTYPFLTHWCRKIGADFEIITERKSPNLPIVMEKLQIRDLGANHVPKRWVGSNEEGWQQVPTGEPAQPNDWNIYVDSDALINPEMPDPTHYMTKDQVAHNGRDMNGVRYNLDHNFLRDGRNIGSCNWFTIASDWCLDLWAPLDIPFEEAIKRVHPTIGEHNSGMFTDNHLLDDYALSRNIAKFGLHFTTITEICGKLGWKTNTGDPVSPFLFHLYSIPGHEKLEKLLAVLGNQQSVGGWGLMTGDQVAEFKQKWGVK